MGTRKYQGPPRVAGSLLLASLVLGLAGLGFALSSMNEGTNNMELHIDVMARPSSDPIGVDGNDDLEAMGLPGLGTAIDPYIIENLVIDADGDGSPIFIQNTDLFLIIRNCTVSGSGSEAHDAGIKLVNCTNVNVTGNFAMSNGCNGIYVRDSKDITVSDNEVTGNDHAGVFLDATATSTVSGNNASHNMIGIYLDDAPSNNVSGNNASQNAFGISVGGGHDVIVTGNVLQQNLMYGILTQEANDIKMAGNVMIGCGIGLHDSPAGVASHDIDTTNTVNGKPVYYYVNEAGLGWQDFTNAGQVILVGCNHSIVQDLNVSGASVGIAVYHANNVTVSWNDASQNVAGIYMTGTTHSQVSYNHASYSLIAGIAFRNTNFSLVKWNTALHGSNESLGIRLVDSSFNRIFLNAFSNGSCEGGSHNTWYNETLGNYWADYEDTYPTATNNGTVWDIPYDLGDCEDPYPLVDPPEPETDADPDPDPDPDPGAPEIPGPGSLLVLLFMAAAIAALVPSLRKRAA